MARPERQTVAGEPRTVALTSVPPMLADALAVNTRTAEQLFADSIRNFLRGAVPECRRTSRHRER